jgi:hypothetical protein
MESEDDGIKARDLASKYGVSLNLVNTKGEGFRVRMWRARRNGVTCYRSGPLEAVIACVHMEEAVSSGPLARALARLNRLFRRTLGRKD